MTLTVCEAVTETLIPVPELEGLDIQVALDSLTALGLSNGAIRYVDSDWGRVERQQTVLIALVSKLTEMGISDYTSLISQLMPYCETSWTLRILSL